MSERSAGEPSTAVAPEPTDEDLAQIVAETHAPLRFEGKGVNEEIERKYADD